jgi:hypothetical protein
MPKSGILVAVLVVSFAFPSSVVAQDHDAWAKPFLLAVDIGLGTPIGLAGLEAQFNPLRSLGFAAGVGTNDVGLQVMLALRPRYAVTSVVAFSGSVAWSIGPDRQSEQAFLGNDGPEHIPEFDRDWSHAQWINADVGVEVREVIQFRPYVGIARLLNVDDFRCSNASAEDLPVCKSLSGEVAPWAVYPYVGFSVGVVF